MTYNDLSTKLEYDTGGVTYTLSGADTTTGLTFHYLGDQGFGLAPLRRITTRGPLQNGDNDIDFRLEPRVLQVPLLVKNESATAPRYQHYQIREKILDIFRPQTSGVLRVMVEYTTGGIADVITRNINVKVLGGLSFDVDPNSWNVRTVVQLRADDPTWYSGSGLTGTTLLTTTYFDTNIGGTQTFALAGNWPTFPIIRVNGPITNPTITNNTTGKSIAITATISAGAYYDIDLSYGKKTVVDNGGVNRISTVSSSSDLATWALAPGNNVIAITGSGTTSASDINFSFYHRYTGI